MKNKRYNLDTNNMLGFRLLSGEINTECKISGQYGAKISVKVGGKLAPAMTKEK